MKKAAIILSVVSVLGTAAYFFYKKQIEKLADMKYQVVGIQLENISLINTVANLKVRITSDSTLEAEVYDLYLDVFVNGKLLGKITENSKIVIPAKGYSIVDVKVATNPLGISSNAMNLAVEAYKNKDATLTLTGKAKIRSAFITKEVSINYTESIKYLMS